MANSGLARTLSVSALSDAELELLLPWYAVGALGAADTRRISAALTSDPALAQEYAAIRREQSALADSAGPLGTPSLRPLVALFAAIDAEVASPANVVAFKLAGTTRYAPAQKIR